MKRLIKLAACVIAAYGGYYFFSIADSTNQPWILVAIGILSVITAFHYLIEAIARK